MDNPGVYVLAARQITAALDAERQTAIVDLDGMSSASFEAEWSGGSGGMSVKGIIRTTFDGGTTYREIARFDFTTAAAVKHATVSRVASWGVSTYDVLAADSIRDGVLGDSLEVEITSVGIFTGAGGVLTLRAAVS